MQEATTSQREHRVLIDVEKDGRGSTLIQGNDGLRSTSFYFTNVLEQVPYFLLRKGFRVCEMLLYVFFAKNRNVCGHVYGFVCHNNVCDVGNLVWIPNNVCLASLGCGRLWLVLIELKVKFSGRGRQGVKRKRGTKKVCKGKSEEDGGKMGRKRRRIRW